MLLSRCKNTLWLRVQKVIGCQVRICSASTKVNSSEKPKPFSAIPGPLALPVLGSSYKYLPWGEYQSKDLNINLKKLHDKYGDIVKEDVLPTLTIVHLFDPDDIEIVFRSEDKSRPPQRIVFEGHRKYRELRGLPLGIANEMTEGYYEKRSPVQKVMLRPKSLVEFSPFVSEVAEDFVDVLRDIRDENMMVPCLHEKTQRYALEAMSTLLLGHGVGVLKNEGNADPEAEKFLKNFYKILAIEADLTLAYMNPLSKAKVENLQEFNSYCELFDSIFDIISGEIRKIEAEIEGGKVTGDYGQPSLIKKMLLEGNMSKEVATDAATTLYSAAIDTTSNSLIIALYIMSKNPEVQRTLHEELSNTLKGEKVIREDHMTSLKYLKAVVKEILRVKPVATNNNRILTKDMVIKGYHVPAGTMINLQNEVISQKEQYFKDPDKFLPERWLRGSDVDHHPFASLPFGFGTRSCIGKRFALQEIYLFLAKVFQNFRVEYHGPDLTYETKLITYPAIDPDFHFHDW